VVRFRGAGPGREGASTSSWSLGSGGRRDPFGWSGDVASTSVRSPWKGVGVFRGPGPARSGLRRDGRSAWIQVVVVGGFPVRVVLGPP